MKAREDSNDILVQIARDRDGLITQAILKYAGSNSSGPHDIDLTCGRKN